MMLFHNILERIQPPCLLPNSLLTMSKWRRWSPPWNLNLLEYSIFTKRKCLLMAMLLAGIFLFGCADNKAREQLADTDIKLSQLEQSVGQLSNKVSNQKMLDILNKLDDLQSQIDQINGNIATLQHNQESFQNTQTQLNQSIEQQLQGVGAAAPVVRSSASASIQQQQPNNSDRIALNSALKKIKSSNFNDAIKQLRSLISSSKDAGIVANANYYLAVAYAANGEYKNSIWIARKFIDANPQNKNVPDALFTMYISQQQLGLKKSAANTAALLKKSYPHSAAARKIK